MSVQDLEAAIELLPFAELSELTEWIVEYHAKVWEEQIENDLDTGRLDDILAEIDQEIEDGLAEPL